jgi:hypothetical protein
MRSLVVLFFFFVLIFGVGTIILSTEVSGNPDASNISYSLGQISASSQSATAVSTEVDRDDDSETLYDCTPAPDDCNLRSAIVIANNDGKPTSITFAANYLIRLSHPLPALTEDNTVIKAIPGQEVHVDGNRTAASVFRITGAHVEVQGLRIYGAGAGYPNLTISENAYDVVIAHNVIGDDDAPNGNCGSSDLAYGGIYVDAVGEFDDGARAWIYGNVIECNRGIPGDGITIRSDNVIIGKDHLGAGDNTMRNIIRLNKGFGVNLTDATGNTVCDNSVTANEMGGLYISNFHNNNIMFNDIADNGHVLSAAEVSVAN